MNTGKMAQLAAFGTIALLSFLPTLLGGQFIWYPESGNWKDAANWRDEHGIEVEEPPGSGDSATINNGGTSQITDERHAAVIDIAYGAGYSGTLQVTGGHSTFGSIIDFCLLKVTGKPSKTAKAGLSGLLAVALAMQGSIISGLGLGQVARLRSRAPRQNQPSARCISDSTRVAQGLSARRGVR